jgi:hypothetical protein
VNLPAIIAMSPAIVRGFLPLADPSTAHSYSAKIIAVALPVIGRKVERAGREMRMPKFVEVLPWVATNKDALLALGAFLSPVTAIIAAAVSYRAVVTGPKVQMRIAQQQNELAEKQFALTEQQARAVSIGALEQKWISDFQEMLGHLFALGFSASSIILRLKRLDSSDQRTIQLLSD